MGKSNSNRPETIMVCPLDSYYPLCENCVPLRRPSPCYEGGVSARRKSVSNIGGYQDEVLVFGGDMDYEIDNLTSDILSTGSIRALPMTNKPFVPEALKGKGKVHKKTPNTKVE